VAAEAIGPTTRLFTLAAGFGRDPPPEYEDLGRAAPTYEERLPALMGDSAASLGKEESSDAIVGDEAQDFGAAWCRPRWHACATGDRWW